MQLILLLIIIIFFSGIIGLFIPILVFAIFPFILKVLVFNTFVVILGIKSGLLILLVFELKILFKVELIELTLFSIFL